MAKLQAQGYRVKNLLHCNEEKIAEGAIKILRLDIMVL